MIGIVISNTLTLKVLVKRKEIPYTIPFNVFTPHPSSSIGLLLLDQANSGSSNTHMFLWITYVM